MTVKIDGVEPNIFPDVDDLDARDAGRNVEVFLDVRVDSKLDRGGDGPVPVNGGACRRNRISTAEDSFESFLLIPAAAGVQLVSCGAVRS
jgi:hypothetical protein